MEQQSGLVVALAGSAQQRAIYNDGSVRAFVSQRRDDRYDLGVRDLHNATKREVKFDQSIDTLHSVLALFGVPEDTGWQPSRQ
jgi:hypothetical protein